MDKETAIKEITKLAKSDPKKYNLSKLNDAIENAGYAVKEVQRMTQDENGRDDYAFILKDEDKKVVWISKMRPMWNDGDYNLLAVGLNFPALSFKTMDELIEKTVRCSRSNNEEVND